MGINADKIYVSFERGDTFYRGTLSPVSGAGAQRNDTFHLSINGYYYGCLRRLPDGWRFDNQWNWNEIAEMIGKQVKEWEGTKS